MVLTFAAVVLCYLAVVLASYGFSDDYRLLAFYDRGGTNRTFMIAEGRPLQALWTNLVFAKFTKIESLAALRLLNVLVIGGAACLYGLVWRRAGASQGEAALLAIATFSLPAFQVVAAVASMGIVPIAIGLAVLTSLCLQSHSLSAWRRVAFSLLALLVLVMAIAAYQPAAMFFWTGTAVLAFLPRLPRPVFLRRLADHFLVGALAMLAGLALHRWGVAKYGSELLELDRTRLVDDLDAKVAFFVSYPLPHALNLWMLFPNLTLALAVGVAVIAGLLLHFRDSDPPAWQRLAVASVFVPLCYMPNLAAQENYPSFRSVIALSALIFAYLVISARRALMNRGGRLYSRLLVVVAAVGVCSAAYNVVFLFVLPQTRELAIVRKQLSPLAMDGLPLNVIRAEQDATLAPAALYDEFGRPSTAQPWSAVDLPYLIFRELRPTLDTTNIRVTLIERSSVASVGHVIDWGHILRYERAHGR